MDFSRIYLIAMMAGIGGAVGGAFAGGFVAAVRCDGGLECLGTAILGVGLGAIIVESVSMAVAAHIANQRQGNLFASLLITLLLAVPIPFLLLPGFTGVLVFPLFFFQVWSCVKIQTRPAGKRRRA